MTELDGRIAQYDVALGGTLAAKVPATVDAHVPRGIVISPHGKSAYVANAIAGPTLDVDAKRKQRVSRLKVKVFCLEESCEAVIGGKAVSRRGKKKRDAASAKRKKTIKLKRKSLSLELGERVTKRLRYRKHRKSVKALKRALRRKRSRKRSKVKAVVNVTARDAVGNSAHESLTVRLKR